MDKIELKVTMEPERLDALRYFLSAKEKRTPEKELQRLLEAVSYTHLVTVRFKNMPDGNLLIRKVCSVNPSVTLQDRKSVV